MKTITDYSYVISNLYGHLITFTLV